jgi:hypothetical protein
MQAMRAHRFSAAIGHARPILSIMQDPVEIDNWEGPKSSNLRPASTSLAQSNMITRLTLGGMAVSCLLFATAALTTACVAPPVAMEPTARAGIRSVRVNPDVMLPPDMLYSGQAEGIASPASGPSPGPALAWVSARDAKSQLIAEMRVNQIDLGKIVALEFAKQTTAGSTIKFVVGADAPADAQVDLTVNVYGIGRAHTLGSMLYPIVSLSATMKTPDGKVVWQGSHVASAQDAENQEGHTLEEYVRDPELLRHAFVTGSDIVSRIMARDLMTAPQARSGHLN